MKRGVRLSSVVCLLIALRVTPAAAQNTDKIFIDVRFGASSLTEDGYRHSVDVPYTPSEPATISTAYDFGTGGHFDIGGGYMLTPVFGVGVNLSGDAFEGNPTVTARVPSPAVLNSFATDTVTADTVLERAEAAVHFQVVLNALPQSEKLRARIFGGPTFFSVDQDVVTGVQVTQDGGLTTPNTIDITDVAHNRYSGSTFGFHIGGDVAYFFAAHVGAGGFVTYSRGTVELGESDTALDVTAGGTSYGAGLNFRF